MPHQLFVFRTSGAASELFDEDEDINFEELKKDIKQHYKANFKDIKLETGKLISEN